MDHTSASAPACDVCVKALQMIRLNASIAQACLSQAEDELQTAFDRVRTLERLAYDVSTTHLGTEA